MLIPQPITLAGYNGATFSQQLNFWQDSAETIPFDFSTWTVAVTAAPTGNASAITINFTVSGGAIILTMTPSATAAAGSAYHVVITLTATSGSPPEVEFLAHGPLTFQVP